jgi:flagellar basal body-associated protein FliL
MKGGILSNAIGFEDECLENDNVYVFISGNYSYNYIKSNLTNFRYQHLLFIESKFYHQEICLWKACHSAYEPLFLYILSNYNSAAKIIFGFENIQIEGINYYINFDKKITFSSNNSKENDDDKGKDEEKGEDENKNENEHKDNYLLYLLIIYAIFIFYLVFCSFICICWEKANEDKNTDTFLNEDNQKSEDTEIMEENIFNSKKNNYKDNKLYKFFSAFNFINNLKLLNKKKEPLSNQNSLVELCLIRLIIIFLIMVGENNHIILKFVDKGTSLLGLTREIPFILIKIGCISYEYYKVISGVIFGFKFINYYKKQDFTFKRFLKFLFKFIPYLIIFLIIHFSVNFPYAQFVKYFFGNIRNRYLSNKINDCFCQRNVTNIFYPLSILNRYKDDNFHLPQYNGCYRPTLFTISESFVYLIVLLLVFIFVKIKKKYLELLFFIINFIGSFVLVHFTDEIKDLRGEYTLSRLFGLSSSITKLYLFFPLYYIGFNIGVIYYYHLHEVETNTELNTNNYIPFEYCYKIALFLGLIKGKLKITLLFIFIILMTLCSSFYTFIMKSLNNNNEHQLIFEFQKEPVAKFMYIYEGLFCGIFFSLFMIIYLTSSSVNFFKIIFSSHFFIFGNKISFVLFNVFHFFIRFTHGISIMEISLTSLYLIRNTVTLFGFSCLFAIGVSIFIFFPIKWMHLFIFEGCNYEKDE